MTTRSRKTIRFAIRYLAFMALPLLAAVVS